MRAILHLCNNPNEGSVFFQILNYDVKIKEGELFNYTEEFYALLSEEAKRDFTRARVKFGSYKVTSTRTEENGYWGNIRYIVLVNNQ